MSYNKAFDEVVVGSCMARCGHVKTIVHSSTINVSSLNKEMCGSLNRKGQLCGKCVAGYAPPVYSYKIGCMKCEESQFTKLLFWYMTVAFLPLTGLYFLVITFKISATHGSMAGYVLLCQVLTTPMMMRLLTAANYYSGSKLNTTAQVINYLFSLMAVWNLDMFRSYYTPFCIHPKMSTLHTLLLDYLIGVYPLFLIFLTYIAVLLHDRYSVVVRMWRPVYRIFACIRKEWDIRGSLIQAFVTFFILSYIRILNVSFDILTPVRLVSVKDE